MQRIGKLFQNNKSQFITNRLFISRGRNPLGIVASKKIYNGHSKLCARPTKTSKGVHSELELSQVCIYEQKTATNNECKTTRFNQGLSARVTTTTNLTTLLPSIAKRSNSRRSG